MVKKFLLLLVLLALVPGAKAITTYDIVVEGDSALVNATFELYTSEPGEKVNYWTTTFTLPENSVLLGLWDSKGKIKNYSLSGSELFLETSKGGLKEKEVVSLLYKIEDVVSKEYPPLKKLNLSLSAFGDARPDVPDEKTFVSVKTGERILSFTVSFGFASQLKGEKEIKFAGNGPAAFSVFFSKGGKEYSHYVLFTTRGNLTAADDAFGIVAAVTGLAPDFEKFPVILLLEKDYVKKVNDWSTGEYSGGLIILKSTEETDHFTATLLHETAHGFNEKALRWQKTNIAWFDEGVAKYVEFLFNKKSGTKQSEIFGEPVKWKEGSKIFTLPSRSSPEELWNYYQSGSSFMESWNPSSPDTREFGYAFGELVVRDFINRNGEDALHKVFQELLKVGEEAETHEEYNPVILGLLDSDFRPCYSPDQEAFNSCLKEINEMDPPIPENVIIKGVEEEIIIPEIQPPEEEPVHITILDRFFGFFEYLFSEISKIFGF